MGGGQLTICLRQTKIRRVCVGRPVPFWGEHMGLTVWIPESRASAFPSLLGSARSAPVFRHVSDGTTASYVAAFPDLPQSLDVAVRLLGETVNCPDVQVTVNGRRVANLIKFWSALICYRDSLAEGNPFAYCSRQAARVSEEAGCPDQACLSHCPFICTRCLQVVRESGAPPVKTQVRDIAVRAEVEWCPNLRLPDAAG